MRLIPSKNFAIGFYKVFLVVFILAVIVVFALTMRANYSFSKKEFYGNVTNVEKDVKGAWNIEINEEWYYLGMYGICIESIQVGDRIQKKKNSFTIVLYRKSEGYKEYLYTCNR